MQEEEQDGSAMIAYTDRSYSPEGTTAVVSMTCDDFSFWEQKDSKDDIKREFDIEAQWIMREARFQRFMPVKEWKAKQRVVRKMIRCNRKMEGVGLRGRLK